LETTESVLAFFVGFLAGCVEVAACAGGVEGWAAIGRCCRVPLTNQAPPRTAVDTPAMSTPRIANRPIHEVSMVLLL
jgi:hypothetical protein